MAKKTALATPDETDGSSEARNAINRKYARMIRRGTEHDNPRRLSFGSLAMDIATGGGLPVGRTSRFYGEWSSGKSLTAWNCVKSAQQAGMSVCYWNVEGAYHRDFVEGLGVDTENLFVADATTIEEIGDALPTLMSEIDFHVIDSLTAAQSEEALSIDIREWRPGIKARTWGKALDAVSRQFDTERNTLILIDQVRSNFKTQGLQAASGSAVDHISSTDISFKKGKWLGLNKDGILDEKASMGKNDMSGRQDADGRIIMARVEKSRVFRPLTSVNLYLDFSISNFDRAYEYTEAARVYGVVESRGGGNYYYPAEEQPGKERRRFRSTAELKTAVAEDKFLQKKIYNAAMKAVLK